MARKVDKRKDDTPWWSEYQQPEPRKIDKKIRSVRGSKKGKVITDYGYRKEVSYERVPRSGYASAFLRIFTLFLSILVLFNIVTDAGYDGYRTTVNSLYVMTETVGGIVTRISHNAMDIAGYVDGSFGNKNPHGNEVDGSFYVAVKRLFAYRDYYKVVYYEELTLENAVNRYYKVVESNYSNVAVGDVLYVYPSLLFGDSVMCYSITLNDDGTVENMRLSAYTSKNRIKHVSKEEYLENK